MVQLWATNTHLLLWKVAVLETWRWSLDAMHSYLSLNSTLSVLPNFIAISYIWVSFFIHTNSSETLIPHSYSLTGCSLKTMWIDIIWVLDRQHYQPPSHGGYTSDRPNVRFGRTVRPNFYCAVRPKWQNFLLQNTELFLVLHSMPMASFYIFCTWRYHWWIDV